MRIPINLASEPFRRDRPMLVGSAACAIALIGLLGLQVYLILGSRSQARDARTGVAELNQQLMQLTNQQAQVDQTVKQPANAQVFQRSLMLNTLVERKSISWTRLFADLERVKPYDVRVIQIRLPKINSQREVQLDMIVGAPDWVPIANFRMKLAESPLFGPVTEHEVTPPSQNQPLYQYHLSVNYAQKL